MEPGKLPKAGPPVLTQAVAHVGCSCHLTMRFARVVPRDSRDIPWWLWGNLLSLDAPVVAVVWLLLFARIAGKHLSPPELAVLALTTWVIYASDRLLDGLRSRDWAPLHERHYFSLRHRSLFTSLLVATALCIFLIVLFAGETLHQEQRAGWFVGIFVLIYMIGVHRATLAVARVFPKELAVGILFAVGTTLPLWSTTSMASADMFGLFPCFALLCFLNCVAIECWENDTSCGTVRVPVSSLVRWSMARLNHLAAALTTCALVCLLAPVGPRQAWCGWLAIAISSASILALNLLRRRLGSNALRVLGDAVLVLSALLSLIVENWTNA